ncbi:hypothetical protein HanPSC8_Chr14g0631221 [Helianthus annuus]|nr:hypothetical protein HanPSC8_Chr14g0631221 [Helianthus annuus]
MTNDSLTSKWRDKIMEGAEGLRTVECLRGRLLAEEQLPRLLMMNLNKSKKGFVFPSIVQVAHNICFWFFTESDIRESVKKQSSEKRLRFLMKKLDSLNISYVSADEYSSSISEKSEISSVSSSKSQPDQSSQKDGSRSFVMRDNDDNVERDQGTYHNVENSMALIKVEEKSITSTRR